MLQAALELLRLEGMSAVSVMRITKRVGVHHSLFYAHWKTLDDCLAALAAHVLEALEPVDRTLRRDVLARAMSDRRALGVHFAESLGRWLEHRPLVELLLAHRLDQTPFGQTLRPALARIRDDIAAELWDIAAKLGVEGKHMAEVRALADLCLNTFLWALEASIDGRESDPVALGTLLADVFLAQNLAAFRRMLRPSYEAMVAARFGPEQRQLLTQGRRQWRSHVQGRDDAALIAEQGGAEAAVEAILRAMAGCFLPQAAQGQRADVAYAVATPEGTVRRCFVFDRGECTVEHCEGRPEPRCTLQLSLRTLLDTVTGVRSFNQAFDAGDIRIDGDVLFSVEITDWFYWPRR
ncbi:MAG: TetR family transcriptional regulator [Polyangiales bacterium]